MPGAKDEAAGAGPGAELDAKIKAQGDTVRKLKTEKADKASIDAAVKSLLELKAQFKSATGTDWKPAAAPGGEDKKAKEKKSPPPAEVKTGPGVELDAKITSQEDIVRKLKTEKADKAAIDVAIPIPGDDLTEVKTEPGAELDAKITNQEDIVRKLKTEKADKADIDAAVKTLLGLKAEYKAATGRDWKPAAAAGGGDKKEKKEKENKSPPPAGGAEEKSDNQKKKDAKKAEKAAKKAAHKSESGKDAGAEEKEDGPDVSAGKYGVQEMNQSKSKPDTRLTHIGDLNVKLDEKTVTIRGRLHTSRAKGKQCFMVIREQQVTVQCLVFVSEKVSKQMVKFASHVSKESIVDVEAVVKKVGDKIESCTQQDVELHVTQVWVVSSSDTQLPLQIEDAGRKVTEDDEGNFARVNQDTRLDNRVLDLRTPTNQAIFR